MERNLKRNGCGSKGPEVKELGKIHNRNKISGKTSDSNPRVVCTAKRLNPTLVESKKYRKVKCREYNIENNK